METVRTNDRAVQATASPKMWESAFLSLARGNDPVVVLDETGAVLRLSRPLGGLKPGDIIGRHLSRCVVPAMATHVRAAVQHSLHPGIAQTVEAAVPTGAGRKWYRFHMVPWRQDDVVLVQCTDVDASHQELERLRSTEQMMRDTQGLSHMGVWRWDITKPHAEWSDGLYAIYGLDPKTHVPTYEDYLTRVHPDDVDRVRTATEAVFNDLAPYSHDERIRHADGSWRHLHTWARPVVGSDGNLQALHGVCMDITERKEAELGLARSEARQKAILENAGLGIATLTTDGRIEDANAAFFDLLGGGQVPCALEAVMDAEAAAHVQALLDGVFAARPSGGQCTIETRTDGERPAPRWVRLMLSLAKEPGERFVVAVAQDVTAEYVAQEGEKRIRQLKEAGRDRARRLGMASHEIKNPLTPMLLQMELLRKTTSDLGPREKNLIDRIGAQVQRLDRLVRDFLDTARAEEGGLPIAPEPVDLVDLARSVVESHRPAAHDVGVSLHVDSPSQALALVDAGRFIQVVGNLIANALRFTPRGGHVRVGIEARPSDHRVTVCDDGVGIPAEGRQHLFSPYGDTGAQAVNPGATTGLGLFVCKAIVEAHGGAIGIDSEPGKGTSAWLTLPRDGPTADAAP